MCVLVEGSKWVRLSSVYGSKCVLVSSQSGFQISVRRFKNSFIFCVTEIIFEAWEEILEKALAGIVMLEKISVWI